MTLKVPDDPPTGPPPPPAPVVRLPMSGAAGVLVPESETMRGCSEVIAVGVVMEKEREKVREVGGSVLQGDDSLSFCLWPSHRPASAYAGSAVAKKKRIGSFVTPTKTALHARYRIV